MISYQMIQSLAGKHQTTELNIVREYFQHLFLSYFYRHKGSAKVFFKGGTALRIIYQSPRFSEDLDFSSDLKNVSGIEDLIVSALTEIEREGISVEIMESKKTSGGYMSIIEFDFESRPVTVQLEISLRKSEIKGDISTIAGDFVPPYTVVQLRHEQLVEEKIQALLMRQKPRDFYDLYFMMRANMINAEKRKIMPRILDVLNNCKISFEKELKIFLPKSHWAVIRDFRSVLKSQLKRH